MLYKPGRRFWLLVLALGLAPVLGTCAVNARDAVVGGAMDFVSGTTADFLSQLIAQLVQAA